MLETQFWRFLENIWKTNGRETMTAGMVDSPDPKIQAMGHYIMSHALLPKDCDKIPFEAVIAMARLLIQKGIQRKTREAIMIILAHHGSEEALEALRMYNMRPNKGLKVFSEMALDECRGWSNGSAGGIFIT